jgi:hypothetical protein
MKSEVLSSEGKTNIQTCIFVINQYTKGLSGMMGELRFILWTSLKVIIQAMCLNSVWWE